MKTSDIGHEPHFGESFNFPAIKLQFDKGNKVLAGQTMDWKSIEQ